MKLTSRIKFLVFLGTVSVLFSCVSQTPESDKGRNVSLNFSETYKPCRFENDNRAEKISRLAPEIHRLFSEEARSKKIPGIAYGIVVDDQLVVSSSAGYMDVLQELPVTEDSVFRIASMTKSFTAVAVLKLRDEGKLSLDDPVTRFVPEMEGMPYLTDDAPILTIENLLTMTGGFPEDNPWGDRQLDESAQMLENLARGGISLSCNPSYGYEYSNTGYALLGKIITTVSGQPFQEYIRENVLEPLGMENTYWEYDNIPSGRFVQGYRWEDEQWKPEPILHDGSYGSMGGLITSVEDFSKYVSFHLSAWPVRSGGDKGLIRRSSIREMHSFKIPWLKSDTRDWNGETCPSVEGYGYGLRINKNCKGLYRVSHAGALPGYGSYYVFYPDYGIGIMAFGNLTYTWAWPLDKLEKLLFGIEGLQPRKLPASDILLARQEQVVELIQAWDPDLEAQLLAENFYLDKSRKHRMAEIKRVFEKAGALLEINEIKPVNQLRGEFIMRAEKGNIVVFFTLSPEKEPKVQYLKVSFSPHGAL